MSRPSMEEHIFSFSGEAREGTLKVHCECNQKPNYAEGRMSYLNILFTIIGSELEWNVGSV